MEDGNTVVPSGAEDEEGNSSPQKHEALQRTESVSSCVSLKSDHSMDPPLTLKDRVSRSEQRVPRGRLSSSEPGCESVASDQSDPPVAFEERGLSTKQRLHVKQQRARSLASNCLSMRSEQSMDIPNTFKKSDCFAEQSVSSCVSLKSDHSMDPPLTLKDRVSRSEQRNQTAILNTQCDQNQENLSAPLKMFEERFMAFVMEEMKEISRFLSPDHVGGLETSEEEEDSRDAREATMKIALHILKGMKEPDLFERLKFKLIFSHQKKLKQSLKSKSERVFEGIAKHGNPSLLNKIYTELYITEGGSGTPNTDHEVRQIEVSYKGSVEQETQINLDDIFKPLPGQDKPIRTVLTKGIAGIGKTVSVQKFILDWANGSANQDVHFMFPLPFRELNLMITEHYSLESLLCCFFKDLSDFEISVLEEYKVVFVFDGLDECRLPLNFKSNKRCSDVTKPVPLDVLLTNLIQGNLLPSALLWITSRPAAAARLPPLYIDQITEVRGFNDPEKEEYFYKRISDQSMARRIFQHVKSSRSLYIMCHIPVFCWISATVLERLLRETKSRHVPKSLTEMYTHFLIFQTVQKNYKYTEGNAMDPCLTKENIISLGKLAFQQLCKGNLIFYENDLRECGMEVKDASIYSGVCTQIFREELYQSNVYCFVHLSFQEYLAALFVYLSWITSKGQIPESRDFGFEGLRLNSTLFDLHKSAVDLALRSTHGRLDLFLQFLLGLSLESSQNLLCELLMQEVSAEESHKETAKYIKLRLGENLRPDQSINLFNCLHELNDHSLVQEIQEYISSKNLSSEKLSPAHWSALVFVLLTSDEGMEVFDLRKYVRSDEGFRRLESVARASRTVILSECRLTTITCRSLSDVLASNTCAIRELDLSFNDLQDGGVKLLCSGLRNPQCRLETLKLQFCGIRKEDCLFLVSAIRSNPSHLRQLDLSCNSTGNQALTELFGLLPDCRIETLRISSCKMTKEGCAFLESAINSKPCHLRKLDLSNNSIGDYGAGVFSTLLRSENCKIEHLWLEKCNITWKSCKILEGASTSMSWNLKELDLSNNDLQDSGVKLLAHDLKRCSLQKLRLSNCCFTQRGFSSLASSLRSNPTCLRELDVSNNFPGRAAMTDLLSALQQPTCSLHTLHVENCGLGLDICISLSTVLIRNSSLRELSLSSNEIRDEGLRTLFTGLQTGLSSLEILRLADCSLTESSCEILASALTSNSTSLVELDLSRNSLGEYGPTVLCSLSTINLIL